MKTYIPYNKILIFEDQLCMSNRFLYLLLTKPRLTVRRIAQSEEKTLCGTPNITGADNVFYRNN